MKDNSGSITAMLDSFHRKGMLITADCSGDDLIEPQGLPANFVDTLHAFEDPDAVAEYDAELSLILSGGSWPDRLLTTARSP